MYEQFGKCLRWDSIVTIYVQLTYVVNTVPSVLKTIGPMLMSGTMYYELVIRFERLYLLSVFVSTKLRENCFLNKHYHRGCH